MRNVVLFALLILANFCFADCSLPDVLHQIRPGEEWVLNGNDTSGLVWVSTTTPPTLSEINAGIADCPNQINLEQRNSAVDDLISGSDDRAKLERAILLTIFDENNNLREWIQAFKGQVAAATSLADLKTRIAGLPDMPDRTVAQAKTAVQNKISSGASD